VPNGMVYLCCTRQLRVLVDEFPTLAGLLKTLSLPNGWFHRRLEKSVCAGLASPNWASRSSTKLLSRTEDYTALCEASACLVSRASATLAWPLPIQGEKKLLQLENIHAPSSERSDLTTTGKVAWR